eukprot:4350937-Amphidinium_carterae.1
MQLVAMGDPVQTDTPEWQLVTRVVYDHWSLPTSRTKAGVRERLCTRLGFTIDGELGRLSVPAQKSAKLLGLTACKTVRGWQSGELALDLARALFTLTSHRAVTCGMIRSRWWICGQVLGARSCPLGTIGKLSWLFALGVPTSTVSGCRPFGRRSGGDSVAAEGLVRGFCMLLTVRSVWPFWSKAARPLLLCPTRSGVSMPRCWRVLCSLVGRTCPQIAIPLITLAMAKGCSGCSTCSLACGA